MACISIHWFRQDLRLADNPALARAAQSGDLLPIYILEEDAPDRQGLGGASRWWLHEALHSLNKSLEGNLRVFRGRPADILPRLAEIYSPRTVSWTRCYEPWRTERDQKLATLLGEAGIQSIRLNGSLLWEPWTVTKPDGGIYQVFTPFYKKGCMQKESPAPPMDAPETVEYTTAKDDGAVSIAELGLMPDIPWHKPIAANWSVGEAKAQQRLDGFIDDGLQAYKRGRDLPSEPFVSRLSPDLHWGHLSPNQVWHAVSNSQKHGPEEKEAFLRQLVWREFSYYQLFHNPALPDVALKRQYDRFEWDDNPEALAAWQRGMTGIPIVDAGMRELWLTGYMHNRVRMIVASFLIKNLQINWREGADWFNDCLVDADLASNTASWQWVAGCGADAAPYFRVFNPVLQGQKFDSSGHYVRRYVPELASLPDKYLFSPWEAPLSVLREAGVSLGSSYPKPLVDLKASRDRALAAYQTMKAASEAETGAQ